jgi:biotin transport system substrate-specific component
MQSSLPIQLDVQPGVYELPRTLAGKAVLTVAATGLMAVCAHISIPLYFTPVPLTLQTLGVLLIGLTLGPSLGFSAMVLYLAEGAMGLPVFSPAGPGGVAQLLGPTGGFLFSYPLAAAAAGGVVRAFRLSRSRFPEAMLGGIAASVVIFTMGAGWLAHLLHLSSAAAWHMGVAPFLPGEVLKVAVAAGLYPSLRRWHRA